jgi:hypothetical protein
MPLRPRNKLSTEAKDRLGTVCWLGNSLLSRGRYGTMLIKATQQCKVLKRSVVVKRYAL